METMGERGIRAETDEKLVDTILAATIAFAALNAQDVQLSDQVAEADGAVAGHRIAHSSTLPIESATLDHAE